MTFDLIRILLLILTVSYREVGNLCQRGSWKWVRFQKIYWKTDQNNFWLKNWDWYHVSNGLSTLIICNILADHITVFNSIFIDTPFYWLVWMYVRNLAIHIFIPLPKYRRYWFAIPLMGGYFDNKFRKK